MLRRTLILGLLTYCLVVTMAVADEPHVSQAKAAFTQFLLIPHVNSGAGESEMQAAAQQVNVDLQGISPEDAFSGLVEAVIAVSASTADYVPTIRAVLPFILSKFQFTDEQIWNGSKRFLDYHAPDAVRWLLILLKEPDFTSTTSSSWEGLRYVETINSPSTTHVEKLTILRIFVKWDEDYAWELATQAFGASSTRVQELNASYDIARPSFRSESNDDSVQLGVATLAIQPENWVRLYIVAAVNWRTYKDLRPVIDALAEDTVPIVKSLAEEKLMNMIP